MPRCKEGDICKILGGSNDGAIIVVLQKDSAMTSAYGELWWNVQTLQPVNAYMISLSGDGSHITPMTRVEAGVKGVCRDSVLEPLPPPDKEETTEEKKELENA